MGPGSKPPQRKPYTFTFNQFDLMSGVLPPQISNQNNIGTSFRYNLDKQLTQITNGDNKVINLNYSQVTGNLESIQGTDTAMSLSYRPNSSQISAISTNHGVTKRFAYLGNLISSEQISGTVNSVIQFGYRSDFKLGSVSLGSSSISYSYDKDDLLVQAGNESLQRDPANSYISKVTLNNLSNFLSYNSFGELTGDTYKVSNKDLYSYALKRDSKGKIIEKIDSIKGLKIKTNYEYDKIGRLTLVKVGGFPIETYAYDANGNRIRSRALFDIDRAKYDDQDRLIQYDNNTYTLEFPRKSGHFS